MNVGEGPYVNHAQLVPHDVVSTLPRRSAHVLFLERRKRVGSQGPSHHSSASRSEVEVICTTCRLIHNNKTEISGM